MGDRAGIGRRVFSIMGILTELVLIFGNSVHYDVEIFHFAVEG